MVPRPAQRNAARLRTSTPSGGARGSWPRAFAAIAFLFAGVLCVRAQGTDVTAPTITIVAPANDSRIAELTGISGTAADEADGSGVASFPVLRLWRYAGAA